MPVWLIQLIFLAFGIFIGNIALPYLKSWASKKGENLATHDDIDKLVDQMRAVTTTTENIRTEIEKGFWDRKRHWEIKRDILFETARKAATEIDVLQELFAIYRTEGINEKAGGEPRWEKRIRIGDKWNETAAALEGMHLVVTASCQRDMMKAVGEFGIYMRDAAKQIMEEKPDSFTAIADELTKRSIAMAMGIRKELEIEKVALSQSSGSLAPPTPAPPILATKS
jgi:hypothetical protein